MWHTNANKLNQIKQIVWKRKPNVSRANGGGETKIVSELITRDRQMDIRWQKVLCLPLAHNRSRPRGMQSVWNKNRGT
jgi:hypothetical protein